MQHLQEAVHMIGVMRISFLNYIFFYKKIMIRSLLFVLDSFNYLIFFSFFLFTEILTRPSDMGPFKLFDSGYFITDIQGLFIFLNLPVAVEFKFLNLPYFPKQVAFLYFIICSRETLPFSFKMHALIFS